jgi:hypothetical protein
MASCAMAIAAAAFFFGAGIYLPQLPESCHGALECLRLSLLALNRNGAPVEPTRFQSLTEPSTPRRLDDSTLLALSWDETVGFWL